MGKRIVLTGGGTAGHVTPNIALLPSLRDKGFEIYYIGSYSGIESSLIQKENIPYYGTDSSGSVVGYVLITEGKGYDGKVVAAEAKYGDTDDQTGNTCKNTAYDDGQKQPYDLVINTERAVQP